MEISINQQITELKRELKLRRRVYPRLVNNGQLTQGASDRQIDALEAALATLREIATMNETHQRKLGEQRAHDAGLAR